MRNIKGRVAVKTEWSCWFACERGAKHQTYHRVKNELFTWDWLRNEEIRRSALRRRDLA